MITINFNGFALTCGLLDSLVRNVSYPLEVIVVDNGSENDEAARLAEKYPEVKVVAAGRNLGFAGANNLGAAQARGEFLFFINNDTEILEDGIGKLVERFDSDPGIGIVCPKIRFWDGNRPIQFAGYTPMKGIALRNDLIGYGREDDGSFDSDAPTPFAHGAAMMVSRKAYEDVGPMPECYFLYFEELDWSNRFTEKGWKIHYEPLCTVFHKESATTGRESALRSYYMTRNRQIFALRNCKGLERELAILYARYPSSLKHILKARREGRRDIVDAILRGNKDFRRLRKEGLC